MSQNTSHAVMARRHEGKNSLDDFPTQPWAVRALCEHVLIPSLLNGRTLLSKYDVWEPACGRGHMARVLGEYFDEVYGTDIVDYGWYGQNLILDFLSPEADHGPQVNWIITNPPFKKGAEFTLKALRLAGIGVCMLVRGAFTETIDRYRDIYKDTPPTIVAYFSERVPMHRGRLLKKGSTASQYIWLVWIKGWRPMPPIWIPPCRKQLQMEADYE